MTIKTLEDLKDIVMDVSYKDGWEFRAKQLENGYFLQVCFEAHDAVTGVLTMQYGRKWYISKYMTKSEVVQTCFYACQKAEEHECRENFMYKNAQIFNPHYEIDELYDFCQHTIRDSRPNPKTQTTNSEDCED